MPTTEIYDVPALLDHLKKCREVRVQPRFGIAETWVKISKADARAIIIDSSIIDEGGLNVTPRSAEMYSGMFGRYQAGTLYLG